jgi:hypothetical protein
VANVVKTAVDHLHDRTQKAREKATRELAAWATNLNSIGAGEAAEAACLEAERKERVYEAARRATDPARTVELAKASSSSPTIRVGREPAIYGRGAPNSIVMDTYVARYGSKEPGGQTAAKDRIIRNARMEGHADEQARAIAETAGSGGELVAPFYWQQAWVDQARADRGYWESLHTEVLPTEHANKIDIPAFKGGATSAATKDLAEQKTESVTTGELENIVVSIDGKLEPVAIRLLELAIPALADSIFLPDVISAYCEAADLLAIQGTGTIPQPFGVLKMIEEESAVTHKLTYTSASPTISGLLSKVAEGYWLIWKTRKKAPDLCLMSPRRWAWILQTFDEQKRPVVGIKSFTPTEAENRFGDGSGWKASLPVGEIMGMRVVLSPSIPTNLGAGTNQDVIVLQRAEDSWALESPEMRLQVARDTGVNKELAVNISVWNYGALIHQRYPAGYATIEGTALNAEP